MTILRGVPRIINPQLLYTLARMGHGDTIVLADANFPAASVASHTPGGLIHCDGSDIPTLLKAILQLLPLDETEPPCTLMGMMPEHKAAGWKTPIWESYKQIANEAEAVARKGAPVPFVEVERFGFYEVAKKAYAVVSTGETALYANLILKKGVIPPDASDAAGAAAAK